MKNDRELEQAVAALPREMQPERDLWQSLEQQLPVRAAPARRRVSRLNRYAGIAAMLVLTMAVGWRLMVVPDYPGMLAVTGQQEVEDDEPLPTQYVIANVYETAKAEQLAQASPANEYFGDWQYQLATWDRAIRQVRDALAFYPDDPRLLSQMQGLYEQQMDYLMIASAVDAEGFTSGTQFSGEEL